MNSGGYSFLQVHLGECPNRRVDCTLGCGQRLLKQDLSLHISSQCSKRPAECEHCHTSVPLHDLEVNIAYTKSCDAYTVVIEPFEIVTETMCGNVRGNVRGLSLGISTFPSMLFNPSVSFHNSHI